MISCLFYFSQTVMQEYYNLKKLSLMIMSLSPILALSQKIRQVYTLKIIGHYGSSLRNKLSLCFYKGIWSINRKPLSLTSQIYAIHIYTSLGSCVAGLFTAALYYKQWKLMFQKVQSYTLQHILLTVSWKSILLRC